jgi:hypothetical protein
VRLPLSGGFLTSVTLVRACPDLESAVAAAAAVGTDAAAAGIEAGAAAAAAVADEELE